MQKYKLLLRFNCNKYITNNSLVKCPILEDKEYTTLTCTYNDQFRSCNQAIADTYLEVTCAPFYEVRNDDRYRICKSNGRWNDDIPQCVPGLLCTIIYILNVDLLFF